MNFSSKGIEISRISLPRLAWWLIAVAMFWNLLYVRLNDARRNTVIGSDGAGYYAYLPALFIHHDLEYNFCKAGRPSKLNYPGADHTLFMNQTYDGKLINKYFIGTAIMEAPFFFIAYGTAPFFGHPANGYSFPFQCAVAIAALFYCLLGLDQTRKILLKKGVSEPVTALTLLLIYFGTNLMYYANGEPAMSHVFSFCMVAVFLNQAFNVVHQKNKRAVAGAVVALAMVMLIRPVNGVAIFAVPFIAGSWTSLKDGFAFVFSNIRYVIIGVAVALVLLFFQLLMYKLSVGHWIADSYSGENIILTKAHIYKVLFSWRKGLFVYTPLMIFACAGIFFLKSNFERLSFAAFWFLNVWIISSWQTWMYGGSFGMRPMVDTYSLMAIPLGFFIQGVNRKWIRIVAAAPLIFVVVLSFVQHYQYNVGILPYDEMTKARYEKLFFRTNTLYAFMYDPGSLHSHSLPANSRKIGERFRSFDEDTSVHFESYFGLQSEKSFSGKYSSMLDTMNSSCGLRIFFKDFVSDSLQPKTWIVIKAKIFLVHETPLPKMAVTFFNGEEPYDWQAMPLFFKIDDVGEWTDFVYAIRVPPTTGPDTNARIFLSHDDQSRAYMDDLHVEVWVAP